MKVNFEKEYWTDVFETCLSLYQQVECSELN